MGRMEVGWARVSTAEWEAALRWPESGSEAPAAEQKRRSGCMPSFSTRPGHECIASAASAHGQGMSISPAQLQHTAR